MSDKENDSDVPEVKILMDENAKRGDYSNFVRIQHTAMDYRFDFARAIVDEATLHVHTRIFMSPIHAKMFLKALEENIKKYEAQFGAIQISPGITIPLDPGAKLSH